MDEIRIQHDEVDLGDGFVLVKETVNYSAYIYFKDKNWNGMLVIQCTPDGLVLGDSFFAEESEVVMQLKGIQLMKLVEIVNFITSRKRLPVLQDMQELGYEC